MRPRPLLLLALFAAFALQGGAAAQEVGSKHPRYDFHVEARIVPTERAAHVTLAVGKGAEHLMSLRFRIDPKRHLLFRGDGDVLTEGAHVTWTPPRTGGKLTYIFRIDHLRDARRYDARCAKTWAIFRGEDLVPPARARVSDGARSRTRLAVRLPEGWAIATPYAKLRGGEFKVEHRRRGFMRPTGWMVAGDLGVVREDVAGMRVAIAGPRTMGVRRQDMLAMLHWTLPTLQRILGGLPERLLIVSAADPMWHGGLSGPNSLFLHAHRPLITEDGPSPLLHEVMHTALGLRPGNDGDWAIEGLAQYYALQLLGRSGTISPERLTRALELQAERGKEAAHLRSKTISGAGTARAVTVLRALDLSIRNATQETKSLDDVVRILVAQGGVLSTERVQRASEQVSGKDLSAFFKSEVP
ncbi:MAG TPA: hypothetical protein VKF60_13310 [Myxococcota bacterium]|nr:hypothetical protein [Myxococcota bacterium]